MNPVNIREMFAGSFIPKWLLRRTDLSQAAKLLYVRIADSCGEDGSFIPDFDLISQEQGVTTRQIQRYMKELVCANFVQINRYGKGRKPTYKFLYHDSLVDHFLHKHENDENQLMTTYMSPFKSNDDIYVANCNSLETKEENGGNNTTLDLIHNLSTGEGNNKRVYDENALKVTREGACAGARNNQLINKSINQLINKEITPKSTEILENGFLEFWKVFPRRLSKAAAKRRFFKIKPDQELINKMLDAIVMQEADRKRRHEIGLWTPDFKYPATWLHGECWLDELTTQKEIDDAKSQTNQSHGGAMQKGHTRLWDT